MISVHIDQKSLRVEFSLTQLGNITKHAIRRGFYEVGVINKDIIERNILKGPRDGSIDYNYMREFGGFRRHSKVNESFFNRLGNARKTLGYDVKGTDFLEVGFRANKETEYVIWLERGTTRMSPRPTIEIAATETMGIAHQLLGNELMIAHKFAAIGK